MNFHKVDIIILNNLKSLIKFLSLVKAVKPIQKSECPCINTVITKKQTNH